MQRCSPALRWLAIGLSTSSYYLRRSHAPQGSSNDRDRKHISATREEAQNRICDACVIPLLTSKPYPNRVLCDTQKVTFIHQTNSQTRVTGRVCSRPRAASGFRVSICGVRGINATLMINNALLYCLYQVYSNINSKDGLNRTVGSGFPLTRPKAKTNKSTFAQVVGNAAHHATNLR